jgi:C1A family cysteine protease
VCPKTRRRRRRRSLTASASPLATQKPKQTSPEQAYELWRAQHGRPASPDRLAAFKANAAFVAAYNARQQQQQQQNGGAEEQASTTARLALNAFADLTWDEFKRTRLGYSTRKTTTTNGNTNDRKPPSARIPGFDHGRVLNPPKTVDWRTKGAVSPVGNQGACGSCYAWSATGAIEGANAIATGEPAQALSVQEIVDCDTQGDDQGCGGGLMDSAFDFVVRNGGLDTAQEYSYYSSWGLPLSWCNRRKLADRRVVAIDGYQDVPADDEEALLKAASQQPVAVAVCASPAMQFYGGGVMAERDCCEELNHGVLLVGYDESSWIVKNSWGEAWGEDGFFRLKRMSAPGAGGGGAAGGGRSGGSTNKPAPLAAPVKGLCGITDVSSYPIKRTADNPRVPSSCDMLAWAECPYASTCGCNWRLPAWLGGSIFPLCLKHDCCPHPSGVDSCGDGAHCCPGDRPVCDPGRGVCTRAPAGGEGEGGVGGDGHDDAVPWLTKAPANYSWGWTEERALEVAMAEVRASREAAAQVPQLELLEQGGHGGGGGSVAAS